MRVQRYWKSNYFDLNIKYKIIYNNTKPPRIKICMLIFCVLFIFDLLQQDPASTLADVADYVIYLKERVDQLSKKGSVV